MLLLLHMMWGDGNGAGSKWDMDVIVRSVWGCVANYENGGGNCRVTGEESSLGRSNEK